MFIYIDVPSYCLILIPSPPHIFETSRKLKLSYLFFVPYLCIKFQPKILSGSAVEKRDRPTYQPTNQPTYQQTMQFDKSLGDSNKP